MGVQNFRRWLNRYSTVMTIVAIAIMLAALGIIFTTMKPTPLAADPVPVYFYDIKTGELFAALSDRIPPITTPSDPIGQELSGVRAHVFSCSDCGTPDDRFIGWLETNTLELKYQLQSDRMNAQFERNANIPPSVEHGVDPMAERMELYEQGHLVRLVEGEQWVTAESVEGINLIDAVQLRCPQGRLHPCMPDASTPVHDQGAAYGY